MEQVMIARETEEKRPLSALWEQHGGLIIAAACLLFIGLAWVTGRNGQGVLEILFFILAYLVGGYRKAWEGLETLVKEKDLDVDLLMVVAAAGAAAIGYWLDGAMLIFIFCLSGALEDYTMEKTNQDIASILKYRPEDAVLLKDDGEVRVRASELQKGDIVLVRPGERIPCDGHILEGHSAVDQSSITGESIPVDLAAGDKVFAGTINGQGALRVCTDSGAEDTLLARIIHLVQEAKDELPPSQLFVERFEGIYAKVVVGAALLLMAVPPFLFGWSWETTVYRAMIFLVVASPCALVSSIMPAILSGISNAARKGVLFKGGVHLEQMGEVNVVAFDKTGTLTEGKPKLTEVLPSEGRSEEELLTLAASLEYLSEHPIAKAIVDFAKSGGLQMEPAANMQAVTGMGVSGTVSGRKCRIGKKELLADLDLESAKLQVAHKLESEGKTVIFVESQGTLIGMLAVQDVLRPGVREAVMKLKSMDKKVVMLTGDARLTAEAIGRAAGVDEVYAGLMPDQKLALIRELTERHGKVAMVGDGVNDAPALAASAVGIAMGTAGTDVALETANVVLMTDDISKIPFAISLGRRTRRVIRQNVAFALAVILILVVSNFWGEINLPSGVVSHEGSTLAVILSGLRLLR
ncbi:Cd2+/Zn2+-exporting ATPase [Paenibacillus forsythiae]|uniref:Cd2+/Zn2+-exporting ATPase n=1 Tax=Paenibacillus forsythiae TaxID=365616 RepID=A0ABU3H660_9BACL|nr:heavy metal translocating P-type ATPase [Paenibacillus forsythiae]MDT3426297.1 Cd2+/Zn2+-exporting ATPase [Paenibacillus forsythiae]